MTVLLIDIDYAATAMLVVDKATSIRNEVKCLQEVTRLSGEIRRR